MVENSKPLIETVTAGLQDGVHHKPPPPKKSAPPKSAQEAITVMLLKDNQAASVVGSTPLVLRQSRCTGLLFGIPAPVYVKIGSRAVRYRSNDLAEWVNQFQPQLNTSQNIK